MLTPPSLHREAVRRHANEVEKERQSAIERHGERLVVRLDRERQRALDEQRERLNVARRERELYLANVRSLFKMGDAAVGGRPGKGRDGDVPRGKLELGAARPEAPRKAPPLPAAALPTSSVNQRKPSLPVSKVPTPGVPSQRRPVPPFPSASSSALPAAEKKVRPWSAAAWSEVSTAAPSTAGGDYDFDDGASCMSALDILSPRRSPQAPLSSNMLQSLDLEVGAKLRESIEQWIGTYDNECISDVSEELELGTNAGGDVHSPISELSSLEVSMSKVLADSLDAQAFPLGQEAASGSRSRFAPQARGGCPTAACDPRKPTGSLQDAKPVLAPDIKVIAGSGMSSSSSSRSQSPGAHTCNPNVSGCKYPKPPCFSRRAGPEAAGEQPPGPTDLWAKAHEPSKPRRMCSTPQIIRGGRPLTESGPALVQSVMPCPKRDALSAGPDTGKIGDASRPCIAAPAIESCARANGAPENVRRGPCAGTDARRQVRAVKATVPAPKQVGVAAPALRALSAEEDALEKSLLRLDFAEMHRQFTGQEPLWRKDALSESFRVNSFLSKTQRENKLKASLDRLDSWLGELQQHVDARRAIEEEARQAFEEQRRAELLRHAPQKRAPQRRPNSECRRLVAPGDRSKARPQSAAFYRRPLSCDSRDVFRSTGDVVAAAGAAGGLARVATGVAAETTAGIAKQLPRDEHRAHSRGSRSGSRIGTAVYPR